MSGPDIRQLTIGPLAVVTYLVACTETREAVIIDPAGEEERILRLVGESHARVRYILNTHGHADHVLANRTLKERLQAPDCMHEADDLFFSAEGPRESASKQLGLPMPDPVEIRLKDNDVLNVGNLRIEVIHTPGHSPGSVCYRVGGNLFTGDTLFVGAAGRTDLPGGSLAMLIRSIETRILSLPPETVIWPGHDYGDTPTSSLRREMRENPYITDFIP